MAQIKTKPLTRELALNMILYIRECMDKRCADALLFELETGLRISDCIRMRYSQIINNTIHIIEKKTGKLQHTKINPVLVEYIFKGRKDYQNDYIFLDGKKAVDLEASNFIRKIQYSIKKACEACGADKRVTSTHSFRKTFANEAYLETKDINLVKALLNHSSLLTTEKYLATMEKEASEYRGKSRDIF